MTIIVDECLPKRITQFFKEDDAWTVPQIGLGGYKDTQLLTELHNKNIDVFLTIDGNIEYQQQFKNKNFGTIIIRSVSNRFSDLERFKKELQVASQNVLAGEIIHIPL